MNVIHLKIIWKCSIFWASLSLSIYFFFRSLIYISIHVCIWIFPQVQHDTRHHPTATCALRAFLMISTFSNTHWWPGPVQDHCVMAVGYNSTAPKPYWIVRNSWASTWGMQGYIYLEMVSWLEKSGPNLSACLSWRLLFGDFGRWGVSWDCHQQKTNQDLLGDGVFLLLLGLWQDLMTDFK